MRLQAAPGPVSYAFIVSGKVELQFGKEGAGNVDAVADSITSLIKRDIRIDYGALGKIMTVYPTFSDLVGVWRKGSAADILTRGLFKLKGIKGSIEYADDWQSLMNMLKEGRVKSITISSAFGYGIPFEDILAEHGIKMPASCGISIINKNEEDAILQAYREGLDRMKEDPEGSAEKIVSTLPIKIPKNFVLGIIKNAELTVKRLDDYSDFQRLVKEVLREL